MGKSTFSAVIFFMASAAITGAFAQQKEGENILRGLEQVYVMVERLKPEIERDGLYSSTLQTDAEMKLKMAGMKIFERADSDEYLKAPCLILQVNALKIAGGYVYDTRVFLREPVVVLRKRIQVDGTTLRMRGQFGCTPRLSDIREEARDAIDDFIKAWQEANSKTP
jgi:hypothetical protein